MATDVEGSRSRSPTPPRARSRSPARQSGSRSRSRERSRSRSRSRSRERARSRSRSRSRSGEARASKKYDLMLPVCRDFTRGRCSRPPSDCRYAHPPSSVVIDGNEVTVCYDSLRDRCARGYGCRYFHPPPHLRAKMQESTGIQGARNSTYYQAMPYDGHHGSHALPPPPSSVRGQKEVMRPTLEVCRDFVRGRCARRSEECRYAHHIPGSGDGDYAIICQDHLRGKCQRPSCRYFHCPNHLRSQIKDRSLGSYSRDDDRGHTDGGYGPYGYDGGLYDRQTPKHMPMDDYSSSHYYGQGHYQGASLPPPPPPPAVLPSPPPRALRDEDKLPVCRDFHLRGNCSRESSCRFVHPDSHVQVADNYVTVCRDSVRGHCKRDRCRFYHPPAKRSSHARNGNGSMSPESTEDTDVSSPEA
eukprot:c22551_g1_i1 orf=114-1358(+)